MAVVLDTAGEVELVVLVMLVVLVVVPADVDGTTDVEVLEDEAIVIGSEDPPEPLQAPSTASIPAAEAAAFHALLMAAPPSGGW